MTYPKDSKRGKSPGSAAARRNAPPAPKKNVRGGKTLTRSQQPEKLETIDGHTIDDTRAFLLEQMKDVHKTPQFMAALGIVVPLYHHVLVCDPFESQMTWREQQAHDRRRRDVWKMLGDSGLTPDGAQRLGLMNAREMESRQKVKPVRTGERARQVAGLLDAFGVIPRRRDDIDGDAVEVDSGVAESEPDVEPPTHIFDSGLPE